MTTPAVPGLDPAFDVEFQLGPLEVLQALLRGQPVDPSEYYFRIGLHLETSAARLADLEQSIFVASAVREADQVRYTAYQVT